jgi:HD-GYP domain-containing protein (c-di-GMP phosphodiesterase class II)
MADEPVQIDVRQLQPGLYVSLGLRWMDHPFLFNSFRLSTPQQVEKLRALGLRSIAYHPARSKVQPLPLPSKPAAHAPKSAPERVPASVAAEPQTRRASTPKAAEAQVAPEVEAYREAINRCEKDYRAAASAIRDLMQQALVSPEQASRQADALVEASMAGLMANRNALLNLICGTAWDGSARYHALNVMNLSVLLGRAAGLRGEALKSLGLGALLHDIGKLQLPPWVLRIAPQNRNRHEEAAYRRHVELGVEMCARLGISEAAALDAVRCHHERIDGSGFPAGLVGDAMPLSARVVAIANRYDELVHGSDESRSLTPSQALARLYRNEAAGFDRGLLQRFVKAMGVWPPGTIVLLSNGMIGRVISVEPDQTLRPTVLIGDPDVGPGMSPIMSLMEMPDLKVARAMKPAELPAPVLAKLTPTAQNADPERSARG